MRALIAILILAAFLRLFDLGSIPPHLRNDEAALGYNAYSILQTQKDEHNFRLPIIFQSFGDWKPGLYIYATVPFIALLGLNEYVIRLPSALAGIFSVLFIYLIVNKLFKSKKLALISGFLLAISPWNLAFSRGAWEANLTLVFQLAGVYFFLCGIFKKDFYLVLSSLFFGLTLLTSHGAKLSSPIIVIILISVFFKNVYRLPIKIIAVSIILGFLISIPVILSFVNGKTARITTLSIFSYPRSIGTIESILDEGREDKRSLTYFLYHNEPLSFVRSILFRWFSHYSADSLFFIGDVNPQHTAPSTGAFLLLDSIFLITGFIALARLKEKRLTLLIILLLILLPLPSSLTIEKIDFERSPAVFIPLVIVASLGVNRLKKYYLLAAVFLVMYLINYTYFLDQYFIHGTKKNDAWQYGYKQVFEKISPLQNRYKKIIVQQSYEHPYIFFLFYQRYDPLKYQSIAQEVFVPNKEGKDMGLVKRVENIYFEDIDWSVKKPDTDTIYVIPSYKYKEQSELYTFAKIVDEVRDLNGFSLFEILETQ